jgi:hypothetical protein
MQHFPAKAEDQDDPRNWPMHTPAHIGCVIFKGPHSNADEGPQRLHTAAISSIWCCAMHCTNGQPALYSRSITHYTHCTGMCEQHQHHELAHASCTRPQYTLSQIVASRSRRCAPDARQEHLSRWLGKLTTNAGGYFTA